MLQYSQNINFVTVQINTLVLFTCQKNHEVVWESTTVSPKLCFVE